MPESPIGQSLYVHLYNDAGVSALVSGEINPGKKPDVGIYPSITYAAISARRLKHHDGASGMVEARFQLTSWATTYTQARAIAVEVRKTLDSYRGTLGGTYAVDSASYTTTVDAIHLEEERDIFIVQLMGDDDDSAQKVHGISQDYMIWHRETVDDNTTG